MSGFNTLSFRLLRATLQKCQANIIEEDSLFWLTDDHVRGMLDGTINPTERQLKHIARLLNVDPKWLIGESPFKKDELTYIYIAHPISVGDMCEHIRNAMIVGTALMDRGYVPFIPGLSPFLQISFPRTYESWLEYDFKIIARYDGILATEMSKPSSGRDREIEYARKINKPVFYGIEELEHARRALC